MVVNQHRQHTPQRLGGHIASTDNPKQPLALAHVKNHRRQSPKLQVGEQINTPEPYHNGNGGTGRMAVSNQCQNGGGQQHYRPKHPNNELIEWQMMLKIGVNLSYNNHTHGGGHVGIRKAGFGVVFEQYYVGRHVNEHRAKSQKKVVQKKQSNRADFVGFDS